MQIQVLLLIREAAARVRSRRDLRHPRYRRGRRGLRPHRRHVCRQAGRDGAASSSMVDAPQHPYSRGLLASTVHDGMRGQRLEAIPGAPPDLAEVPTGCSFAPRCKFVRPDCTTALPVAARRSSRQPRSCAACWRSCRRKAPSSRLTRASPAAQREVDRSPRFAGFLREGLSAPHLGAPVETTWIRLQRRLRWS